VGKVDANGIQIEYETFGEPDSPALLLIIGLAGQLIDWDEKLCHQLAQKGHYVIRFDNRDAGLSSKIEEAGEPDIIKIIEALMRGETIDPPYTIEDMAAHYRTAGCFRYRKGAYMRNVNGRNDCTNNGT
jgi:pimeloyl-ACP methyl ester carboxylesterase